MMILPSVDSGGGFLELMLCTTRNKYMYLEVLATLGTST